jgi:small subunit ribosomal protein S17
MSEKIQESSKSAEQATNARTIEAVVISTKMNKTIVVKVERKVKHPVYGKYVRRSSRYYVHAEQDNCREGDLVLIEQCRPLSKLKRWKLIGILKRQEQE